MAPSSTNQSRSEDNICRRGKVNPSMPTLIIDYYRTLSHLYFFTSRDGSILHRSLSTNATTCRNLNNLNAAHKNVSIHEEHNASYESPKVQNMEEISLMSLEKDLKNLEELNNYALRRKSKITDHLSRFFQRRPNKFRI